MSWELLALIVTIIAVVGGAALLVGDLVALRRRKAAPPPPPTTMQEQMEAFHVAFGAMVDDMDKALGPPLRALDEWLRKHLPPVD